MIRAFDFDKTIYNGFSYRDFCFYVTRRRPWLILYVPMLIIGALLTLFRVIKMKHSVEFLLWPYLRFKNIDKYVEKFWEKNIKKIQPWYLKIHKDDDIIVSATPSFFLEVICKKLGVKHLIATEIDRKTCKVVDPYCYRAGKWERFTAAYGEDVKLDEYYTDTMRDAYMLEKAERGFMIKKGQVIQVK